MRSFTKLPLPLDKMGVAYDSPQFNHHVKILGEDCYRIKLIASPDDVLDSVAYVFINENGYIGLYAITFTDPVYAKAYCETDVKHYNKLMQNVKAVIDEELYLTYWSDFNDVEFSQPHQPVFAVATSSPLEPEPTTLVEQFQDDLTFFLTHATATADSGNWICLDQILKGLCLIAERQHGKASIQKVISTFSTSFVKQLLNYFESFCAYYNLYGRR